MNRLLSFGVRTLSVVVAIGTFAILADLSGLAQQAPAPGAAAGQEAGQRGAGAAAPAQGRGGGGGGRGVVPLGDGPWEYGNGPNRYRAVVVTKNVR